MPVPEAARHPSRTPAQAIKQPSNDLYKAQGINPAEELHPSSDQFVAQNYGSAGNAQGYAPTNTNYRSYNQPELIRRDLESGEVNPATSYREEPHHAQHYTTASGLRGEPREQELSQRFINNSASQLDAGRHRGYDTQNVSDRLPSNVPSTREMVSNLEKGERILEHRKHDTTNAAGDRVIDDLTQVVKDTVNLVEEKNLGDSTRNIIDHSKSMTSKVDAPNLNTKNLPNKDTVTRDVSDLASQLRRVTQLMVTSPAFRSFLWEFYQLSRDTFGPQIENVVGQKLGVQEPTDRRFDEAPKYGQEHRLDQFSVPPISNRSPLNDEFSQNQLYMGSARDGSQLQQSGNNAGFTQPQFISQLTVKEEYAPLLQPSSTGLTGEQRYSELNPYGERFREHAVPQVADDIKHAKNQILDTKNKIPSEKREQLAQRWRAMFDEIKQDSRIQEAVRDMKQTLVYLRDKYQPVVQEHKEKVLDAAVRSVDRQDEEDVNVVLTESKGLLERFAGGKSLDALINVINEWYTTIRNDEQLREWLEEFYDYLDTTVHTPETLEDDRHIDKLDHFLLRGQDIFQGRHRELSRQLLDETNDFLYSLINDEATTRLRASLQRVIKDLFLDSEGRFVLKPDLYVQLRKAFMPIVREQLSNIGVSHVEDHNDQIDFALSNIIIDANEINPDQFDVKNVAEIAVGKEAKDGAELHMEFRISAKGATCSVRDVNFYYKKHTFPKLKDSGILDASLTRNGLSFEIDVEFFADATGLGNVGRRDAALSNRRRDRDHSMFRVKNCRVDIDKLDLNFREAKHDTLYKIFKPIIVSKATKAMSRAIEDQLRHIVDELDRAAIQARDQTLATLEKTGANDRVLRGTEPEKINVGHSHNDRQSEYYN